MGTDTGYDFVLVGAGISSAAFCATLPMARCLVLETRDHIAGNCYDYLDKGTYIHKYGPHIFHTPNTDIVEFLSRFTEWNTYEHSVDAEVLIRNVHHLVPFPYSLETEKALMESLSDQEIVDAFFRDYSKKMWGKDWDSLPASIRNRVPKRQERSNYFPDQFVGMPRNGWTSMVNEMFGDRVTVRTGVDSKEWIKYLERGERVVYCGRLDRIPGARRDLSYRHLDIKTQPIADQWNTQSGSCSPVINVCHDQDPVTRKTCYRLMTGGISDLCTVETPVAPSKDELAPFYPDITADEADIVADMKDRILDLYPNLVLLGRLASHKYLDAHQAVGLARKCAKAIASGAE